MSGLERVFDHWGTLIPQKEVTTYHLVPMRTDTKPLCVYQDLRCVCPPDETSRKKHAVWLIPIICWVPFKKLSCYNTPKDIHGNPLFLGSSQSPSQPTQRGKNWKFQHGNMTSFWYPNLKNNRGWYAGKIIQNFLGTICKVLGETRSKNSKNSQKICQNTKLLSYTRATSKIALGFIKPHQGTLHWQELFIWKSQVCPFIFLMFAAWGITTGEGMYLHT